MTENVKKFRLDDPKVQRSLTEGFIKNVLKDQVKEGVFKPGEYILFHHSEIIVASHTKNVIEDAQKLLKGPSDIILIGKHKIVINPETQEEQH